MAWVYVGNYFSAGVGGLLAGAILRIPGTSGLRGWQVCSLHSRWVPWLIWIKWLFLIDGSFTVIVGVAFMCFMPKSPNDTRTLVRCKRFNLYSDRERHIMGARVLLDDLRKAVRLSGIGFRRVLRILKYGTLWGHIAIHHATTLAPKGGLGYSSPVIVQSLGHDGCLLAQEQANGSSIRLKQCH